MRNKNKFDDNYQDFDNYELWGQKRGLCDKADDCYSCPYADECFNDNYQDFDNYELWGQKRGLCDKADDCYSCPYADECFN